LLILGLLPGLVAEKATRKDDHLVARGSGLFGLGVRQVALNVLLGGLDVADVRVVQGLVRLLVLHAEPSVFVQFFTRLLCTGVKRAESEYDHASFVCKLAQLHLDLSIIVYLELIVSKIAGIPQRIVSFALLAVGTHHFDNRAVTVQNDDLRVILCNVGLAEGAV